tara:strand:- start:1631 stop:1840 length:210 start_codon:yes stop_codon:yes gene_type:complete
MQTVTIWASTSITNEATDITKWYSYGMLVSAQWMCMAINFPTGVKYFDTEEEASAYANEMNRLESINKE